MIIQSSIRAAKVNPQSVKEVRGIVSDSHDIAWEEDENASSSALSAIASEPPSRLPHLKTQPLEALGENSDSKTSKDIKLAYLNLGMNATSLAGQYFPEVFEQPIQGMEFVVASATAFESWRDKERTSNVKASLATGKALLEAIDVLAPFVPGLKQVQPYTQVAGVILKTAESAYIVYAAHQDK